jgi:hypothetical protein
MTIYLCVYVVMYDYLFVYVVLCDHVHVVYVLYTLRDKYLMLAGSWG